MASETGGKKAGLEKRSKKPVSSEQTQPALGPSAVLSAAERRKLRTPKVLCAATNKEQVQAVIQVGERLRLAREMNGWDVSEAARRLGFENPSSLSRFELAKHVSAIPLYILPRAAQVYGVSTDYLHGLTDDLSLAPDLRFRRDIAMWLANEMERARLRDMETMLLYQEQMDAILKGTREVVLTVEELCAAIGYMRSRSVVTFENMPGGSKVLFKSEQALGLATSTAARLARFKSVVRTKPCAQIDPQLSLLLAAR